MKNTADVTGVKPIFVLLQSISDVSANPLVAFYDIHGGKREVLFYFVPDTTRDYYHSIIISIVNRRKYEKKAIYLSALLNTANRVRTQD
jgi:hypothetical protein